MVGLDRIRQLPRWRKILVIVILVVGFGPLLFTFLYSSLTGITMNQAQHEIPYFIYWYVGFICAALLVIAVWYVWKFISVLLARGKNT
jgi:hypothetical protein